MIDIRKKNTEGKKEEVWESLITVTDNKIYRLPFYTLLYGKHTDRNSIHQCKFFSTRLKYKFFEVTFEPRKWTVSAGLGVRMLNLSISWARINVYTFSFDLLTVTDISQDSFLFHFISLFFLYQMYTLVLLRKFRLFAQ